MTRSRSVISRHAAGFSLVEILVAMVIGLIATLVVMQVFFGSEARGRTASGNADAQSNGVMTFYQLQSHIQKAGYGLDSIGLYNCLVSWTPAAGTAIDKSITLAPVTINPVGTKAGVKSLLLPAGDANTDTLLVVYGNGNGQPQGNPIIDSAALVYTMQMPGSFAVGDRVILALGTAPETCGATVLNIDRVAAVNATTVTLVAGGPGVAMFNLGKGPNGVNVTPSSTNPSNGPTILAYAVRNGNLTACDFTVHDCSLAANANLTTVWVPIANNIVSMRATYWNDTSVAWDGSSSASNQTQPTTACLWAKVKAVSLVMVARNAERNKNLVTTTTLDGVSAADANMPVWDQDAVAPLVASTGALGPNTAVDEEWKYYRYKTFQALIPLRNVNWMGRPTGC